MKTGLQIESEITALVLFTAPCLQLKTWTAPCGAQLAGPPHEGCLPAASSGDPSPLHVVGTGLVIKGTLESGQKP